MNRLEEVMLGEGKFLGEIMPAKGNAKRRERRQNV